MAGPAPPRSSGSCLHPSAVPVRRTGRPAKGIDAGLCNWYKSIQSVSRRLRLSSQARRTKAGRQSCGRSRCRAGLRDGCRNRTRTSSNTPPGPASPGTPGQDGFAQPVAVHVGRIKKRDAEIQRLVQEADACRLVLDAPHGRCRRSTRRSRPPTPPASCCRTSDTSCCSPSSNRPVILSDETRPRCPEDIPRSALRLPKNSSSPRLLKRAQMQGGAPGTRPSGRVQVRGVLCTYVAVPRERVNAADGPFSAACYAAGGWFPAFVIKLRSAVATR